MDNKYAVVLSREDGSFPYIEATDLSFCEATRIARIEDKVEVLPIGRATSSWLARDGRIWNIVPSKKNAR